MKRLKYDLDTLLKRFENMPTFPVLCPACRKTWERLGKPPADYDGICPECYDKGARAGFRKGGPDAPPPMLPRAEFLRRAEFPEKLQETPFRARTAHGLDWNGQPWSLGYVGPSETGKSMLLTEITWRNQERFRTPFYVRGDRLVSALYGRMGKEEEGRHYRRAIECPLLIVDDLGWGTRGNAMDPVFEVLADRHGNNKPTLWSANASVEALAHINAPLARRLFEGTIVQFKEGDEWL